MSMIERVARAIDELRYRTRRDDGVEPTTREEASAAIAAMREPSGVQCSAGNKAFYEIEKQALYDAMENDTLTHRGTFTRHIWYAMIDAALEEK